MEYGSLYGYIGQHKDGAIGLLFINEEYSKNGYAKQLIKMFTNYIIDKDGTAFCRINTQEKEQKKLLDELGYKDATNYLYACYNQKKFKY